MTPILATGTCLAAMLALFLLDRKKSARTSWSLWIPILWLSICSSRHVSEWLGGMSTTAMAADQYLEGSPVDATVYGLLTLGAMLVLATRWSAVVKILRRNQPVVLFVLFCALSITWSDFPAVALKRWIKSLGDYSMILLMLTEYDCESAIRRALARVSLVIIPLSILFIKYYPQLGRSYAAHWDATQFFVGVCDNKNMLGMVCLIFGITAWCRVLEAWQGPKRQKKKELIVHGGILAMAIWLLMMSDSKTSLSCFVLTGAVLAAHAFLRVARRRAVLNILVISVVLTSAAVLFLGIGGGALKAIGRNSTLTGRTDIWSALLSVHTNPIFGTGFESFWLGPRLTYLWTFPIVAGITEAHDGYLEMYLNLGWLGLGFMGAMIWTGYRNIQRLLERAPALGRLRLGYFVIALIYNFTEAGFRSTDLIWFVFVLSIMWPPLKVVVPAVAERRRRKKLIPEYDSAAELLPEDVAVHAGGLARRGFA
jgi:exopolysaccharide production protein ExoQ